MRTATERRVGRGALEYLPVLRRGMAGNPKRLAWQRGRRWEYRCRNFFRSAGFRAERCDESDGFAVGVDILLSVYMKVLHAWKWVTVPVAIQCKCSERPTDLFKGLDEARRGWKNAKLWICLHWYREDGQRGRLRMARSDDPTPGAPYALLKDQMDAVLGSIEDVIPTTKDPYDVIQDTKAQLIKEAK